MIIFLLTLSPICAWLVPAQISTATATGNLTVSFENLEKTGGTVLLALYDSPEKFMAVEKAMLYSFKVISPGKMEVSLPDLPYGTYAFAVFQDENENKELDKNLFGVPVEPYAFSKTPTSKWRVPKFDEVKFNITQPNQSLTVRLEKWKL